jgi:hypothetical protein
MTGIPDRDAADEALLAVLQRVAEQVDPAPGLCYDLARAAFILRDLDSQLAALTHDSAVDSGDLVRAGGEPGVRLLSYEAGELTVELQVSAHGAGRAVLGEVNGGAVARLAVQTNGATIDVVPDELGRFRLDDVPAGPFRIRLVTVDGRSIRTSWVGA